MDTTDKLKELINKMEEIDDITDEYDKIQKEDNDPNEIKTQCIMKGAFDIADELEKLVDDLDDDDLDEIEAAVNELDQSIEDHKDLIKEMTEELGKYNPQLFQPINELAKLYHIAARFDEEITTRKQALDLLRNNINYPKSFEALTLRELIAALNEMILMEENKPYEIERNLHRQQLFSIYKFEFKNENDDDIDLLIDITQFLLKIVEYMEVKEQYDKAEKIYNRMVDVDVNVLEYRNPNYTSSINKTLWQFVDLLDDLDLNSITDKMLEEFPQLKTKRI